MIIYIFYLLDPKKLNFQVPKSQNFWISRPPDLQIPKIPDFQVPRFPDAAGGAAGAGRTLRSQPDPSPNAPRDQIRRKDPCCDLSRSALVDAERRCLKLCSLSRANDMSLQTLPDPLEFAPWDSQGRPQICCILVYFLRFLR